MQKFSETFIKEITTRTNMWWLLLIPLLMGFTYVDYEPGYWDTEILWLDENSTYAFEFSSFYRGLDSVSLSFVGDCDANITFQVKKNHSYDIIGNGTKKFLFDADSEDTHIIATIQTKGKDNFTFEKLNFSESYFFQLLNNTSIEKETTGNFSQEYGIWNITKNPSECGLIGGSYHPNIGKTYRIYSEYNLTNYRIIRNNSLQVTPQIEITYNATRLGKLWDSLGYIKNGPTKYKKYIDFVFNNTLTWSIYVILLVFSIVGCFYYPWKKMIELCFLITLAYYIILRAVAIILPIPHVVLLPLIGLSGIAYITTHYKKIMRYLKE